MPVTQSEQSIEKTNIKQTVTSNIIKVYIKIYEKSEEEVINSTADSNGITDKSLSQYSLVED